MSEKLLPCPFCASSEVKMLTDDGIHLAQCKKCEATGPTGFKRGDVDDPDWNSRATVKLNENKLNIVVDKVDDICEKFELENLHSHPTYKRLKRLHYELAQAKREIK